MKVLFVCTANVCRSPLAEGYLKFLLQKDPVDGIEVSSAGVLALSGLPAFSCAAEVAKINEFDISDHRARRLTRPMAIESDVIFCMETWQVEEVLKLDPELSNKVALLGRFYQERHPLFQIPDPREFSVAETLKTFDQIRRSVQGYLESVRSSNPS